MNEDTADPYSAFAFSPSSVVSPQSEVVVDPLSAIRKKDPSHSH